MQRSSESELQLKIHQILNRSGYYRLPLLRLSAILRLLGVEEAREAKLIQVNTITGLIQLTNTQRQMKPNYFAEGQFPSEARDMQEYLSAIVRAVIAERFPSEVLAETRAPVTDPLAYPFNPFNCMGYPPSRSFAGASGLFPGRELPPPTLPYGNAYLPYSNYTNPEMYYYRMYGAYPPPVADPRGLPNRQQEIVPELRIEPGEERESREKSVLQQKQKNVEKESGQGIRLVEQELKEEEQEVRLEVPKKQRKRPIRKQKLEPKKVKEVKEVKEVDEVLPIKKSRRLEEKKQRIESVCDFKMSEKSLEKRNRFLDKIFQYERERRNEQKERQAGQERAERAELLEQAKQQKEHEEQEQSSYKCQEESSGQGKPCEEVIEYAVLNRPKRIRKMVPRLKETFIPKKPHRKREPSLQLKYYNSITDFDYRVYPPKIAPPPPPPAPLSALAAPSLPLLPILPILPPLPPKKPSATVETQTELNLLLNDFRIIKSPMEVEVANREEAVAKPVESLAAEAQRQEGGLREEMHHLHIEEPNSSSIRIDRVHHLMEASSHLPEQNFHLGLEHDPHLEHPKSHDEPSQGNELIAEEMQGEGIVEEEGAAVQDAEEAGKPAGPVFEEAFINCACAGHGRGAYISCETCCSLYHPQCLRIEQPYESFECPRCRMRGLNPSLEIRQVCGEYFLQGLRREQFRTQVDLVKLEYLSINKRGHERVEELELRCVRVDSREELREVEWPDEAELRVNGEKVTEFYQALGLRRRRDAALVITQAAFKVTSFDIEECGISEIAITLKPPPEHSASRALSPNNDGLFLLGLYHTFKPSLSVFFQRVSEALPACGEEFLRGLVAGKEEVGIEREVFRLHDPFTNQLMQMPVRGTACRHGQCFDLRTFLALMSGLRHRAWRCPVCGRDARKLVGDLWMLDLIRKTRQANSVPGEVEFLHSGEVVLKMERPEEEEEEEQKEDSEEMKRKAKQQLQQRIKKKARPVKKENHEDPIRAYESHYYADIDKYLAEELQQKARKVKN